MVHWQMHLQDRASTALFDGPLAQMQYAPATVKALSIEFFGDPEPCQIHRCAVIQRAMAEIEAACPVGVPLALTNLPPRIAGFFASYPDAHSLTLIREERQP